MRKVYLLVWLLGKLLIWPGLLINAQDLSGVWQGTNYSPPSIDTPYWPISLTLTQNNDLLTGQCLEINSAKPQYYSLWNVTNGSVQNEKGSFDLITSKQQTREFLTYWCTGTVSFTYYPTEEKIVGISTYNNCDWQSSMELYRLALKSPSIYCKGQAINLLITGNNVKWYADKDKKNLINQGNTFTPTLAQTTIFYVTQTNYNIESPAVPITIEIVDMSVLQSTVSDARCAKNNGVISLTATAGSSTQYRLNNGSYQTSPVFLNLSAGSYTVSVKDQNNCQATKEYVVKQQNAPHLLLTATNRTCSEEGLVDVQVAEGQMPYQYSLDSVHFQTDNRFKVASGSYTIFVRDANNCLVHDTVTIEDRCSSMLLAPDAFTPNGDGQNDTFVLIKPYHKTALLTIYNRWGEVIFQTDKAEWNGMSNGVVCSEGVYNWQVELFEAGKAEHEVRTGQVVLIR